MWPVLYICDDGDGHESTRVAGVSNGASNKQDYLSSRRDQTQLGSFVNNHVRFFL